MKNSKNNPNNPHVSGEMDLVDLFQAVAYERTLEESTISLREAADYLDLEEESLIGLADRRRIPAIRDSSGRYRFTLPALDHYSGFKFNARELKQMDEVSTKMVTAILGLNSRPYITYLIQSGKLKGRKLESGDYVVKMDSIERYLKTHSRDKKIYPLSGDRHLYLIFLTDSEAEKVEELGYQIVRRDFEGTPNWPNNWSSSIETVRDS